MSWNEQQAEWRRKMIVYMLSMDEFRNDLIAGKVPPLSEWGIVCRAEADSIVCSLAEDENGERAGNVEKSAR